MPRPMASSSTTNRQAPAAGVSQRACLRCIAKKRRCDHERPVCGSCNKLKVTCEYPPPQSRRGPVPGLSKRAEWRVQQCENALWYLLNVPGVTAAVRRAAALAGPSHPGTVNGSGPATRAGSAEDADALLPSAPTSTLDREARAEWWSSHRLDTAGDILDFRLACRKLAGDERDDDIMDDTPAVAVAPVLRIEPEARAAPSAAASPTSVASQPAPPAPAPPAQIYTPASSSLRNSMGPSLWQLVTAAIPDSDSAGFARELRELRARRERAVTAAGDADAHAAHAHEAQAAQAAGDMPMPQSPHEGGPESGHERELRRRAELEADPQAQAHSHALDIERLRERERERERRTREENARAELALFEAAIAKDKEEERAYELRRIKDREDREERARAAAASGHDDGAAASGQGHHAQPQGQGQGPAHAEGEKANANNGDTQEDERGDRFPGLRLPLGVLPNEHLAWTYGAGGVGGVGGAGKRRRLEDMFW